MTKCNTVLEFSLLTLFYGNLYFTTIKNQMPMNFMKAMKAKNLLSTFLSLHFKLMKKYRVLPSVFGAQRHRISPNLRKKYCKKTSTPHHHRKVYSIFYWKTNWMSIQKFFKNLKS